MDANHRAVKEGATHWSPAEPDGSRVEAYWRPNWKGGYDCWAIASWYDGNEWQVNSCDLPSYAIPIALPTAWSGEGLPPVGAVCEWKEKTGFSWVKATVLFITGSSVVMQREDGFEWQMMTARTVFRPIRTPEQIAAEEREKGILQLAADAGHWWKDCPLDQLPPVMAVIYDAGYRKLANPTSE